MKKHTTTLSFFLAMVLTATAQDDLFQQQPDLSSPTLGVTKEQASAVFIIKNKTSAGTGFACTFKGKEWVATNLHVIDGGETPAIVNSSGAKVPIMGYMVYAGDADVCLLAIKGSFKDIGITPLPFSSNVINEAKAGDAIMCPGNSLDDGVIKLTPGEVRAFGPKKVEISNPIFQGNSGGPVIHMDSGKVIGLVTEAYLHGPGDNEFVKRSLESPLSATKKITYIAHRIDTVQEWGGCQIKDYLAAGKELTAIRRKIDANCAFLTGQNNGWQHDKKLSAIETEFNEYIDKLQDRSAAGTKRHRYVDWETGSVVNYSTYHGLSTSKADLEKRVDKYNNSIKWKISSDYELSKKAKAYGYRQIQDRRASVEFLQWLSEKMNS